MLSSDVTALCVTALLHPGYADTLLRAYPYLAERRAAGDTRPVADLLGPPLAAGLRELVASSARWAASQPALRAFPGVASLRPDAPPRALANVLPMPSPPVPRAPRLTGVMARRRMR